MKIPPLLIAWSLVALRATAEKPAYSLKEGEDATSSHYYFLYSDGDSINRVRWVWNGGAGNKPTVTEYLLKYGELEVIKLTGERKFVTALEAGDEPKLNVTERYKISLRYGDHMILTPEGKAPSFVQRTDLNNLISILAKERAR